MVGLPQIQCRPTPRLWQDAFSPLDVPGLELWLDAYDLNGLGYRGSVANWADRSGNGRNATQGIGSAQPKVLTWGGENYLHLPGVAGNYLSSSRVDVNGDLRGEFCLSGNDWTPAGNRSVAAQRLNSSSGIEFELRLTPSGHLVGIYNVTDGLGVSSLDVTSSEAVPFSDGEEGYIAFNRSVSSGEWVFEYSVDGENWLPLGAALPGTGGSLFTNPGTPLEIGSVIEGAANLWAGKVSSGKLYLGGTLVRSFDASRGNANSDTLDSETGETWTIHRTGADPACIVSAPVVRADGTDDFLNIPTGAAIKTVVLMGRAWENNGPYTGSNPSGFVVGRRSTGENVLFNGSVLAGGAMDDRMQSVYGIFDGVGSSMGAAGVQLLSGDAGALFSEPAFIFRNHDDYGVIDLHGCAMFSGVLGADEIKKVSAFFAASARAGISI